MLKIEYCGREFSGWQSQKNERTVQTVIKESLGKFLGHDISLIAAGRTDSGVHALGQYANFYTVHSLSAERIMNKLNKMLPPDIVIKDCRQVDPQFNSRKDAISRSYKYIISERNSALRQGFAWIISRPLDLDRLNQQASFISRSNYFHNFCKTKSLKSDNRCQIKSAAWIRMQSELIFEITANRFLHHMVRLLVGSMLAVVDGKLDFEIFVKKFDKNVYDKARYIAPPYGLYLVDVQYEGIKL